jgi:outer membrane protein assembly factor BamB
MSKKIAKQAFIHASDTLVSIMAILLMVLFVSGCGTGAGRAGGFKYEVVLGWPELPAGMEFEGVTGVATDSTGRVYVAGGKSDPVFVFSKQGRFLDSWGAEHINAIHGLRIFDDRIWITDRGNQQVFEFTLGGELLRSFGTKGIAGEGFNQFNKPTDVAIGDKGRIYISDGYENSRVVCYNADGSFYKMWGSKGSESGQFDLVHNISVDSKQRIYIADRDNMRVQVFDSEGNWLRQWNKFGQNYGLFITPEDILFVTSGKGNEVFIADVEVVPYSHLPGHQTESGLRPQADCRHHYVPSHHSPESDPSSHQYLRLHL